MRYKPNFTVNDWVKFKDSARNYAAYVEGEQRVTAVVDLSNTKWYSLTMVLVKTDLCPMGEDAGLFELA